MTKCFSEFIARFRGTEDVDVSKKVGFRADDHYSRLFKKKQTRGELSVNLSYALRRVTFSKNHGIPRRQRTVSKTNSLRSQ